MLQFKRTFRNVLGVFRCVYQSTKHLAGRFVDRIRPQLPKLGTGVLTVLTLLLIADRIRGLPQKGWWAHLWGLTSAAVTPGFIIGVYVYSRDRFYDESMAFLGKIFFYSVVVSTLAIFTNEFGAALLKYDIATATVPEHFTFFFFVVAPGEEFFKFIVVWKLAYKGNRFKQVYDGILFCGVSAIGFATIENFEYVLSSGPFALDVALKRALTAVPSHIVDGIIMGYGLGKARTSRGKSKEQEWIFIGMLGAVVSHGLYDFLLVSRSLILWLITMVGGWILAWHVLRISLKYTPFTYCDDCQRIMPQVSSYCPHCRSEHRIELTCNHCGTTTTKWSRRCMKCHRRIAFPWYLQVDRIKDFYPRIKFEPCRSCGEKIPLGLEFCLHCGSRVSLPVTVISDDE